MNLNSFVIDRPLRGMMLHSGTGEVMWTINQIEDPSLQVSAETADAVDALGVPIMSFDRAKSAEFSASSSLFDLGLLAAQSGSELEKSDASTKIVTPCFEEITRGTEESATLKHTPKGTAKDGIPYIYVLQLLHGLLGIDNMVKMLVDNLADLPANRAASSLAPRCIAATWAYLVCFPTCDALRIISHVASCA